MAPHEVIEQEKHIHHGPSSLRHERRRVRKMKVIFGVFSGALLLSLILSWFLSH